MRGEGTYLPYRRFQILNKEERGKEEVTVRTTLAVVKSH